MGNPAAATKAHRHPTVRAMDGTANPPSSVAAGTPDCFTANAIPRRAGGTVVAMKRLAAGWASTLATPPRASQSRRLR